jgi:hypothetical protein
MSSLYNAGARDSAIDRTPSVLPLSAITTSATVPDLFIYLASLNAGTPRFCTIKTVISIVS